MADEAKGAVHLTKIDFDITSIKTQMESIQNTLYKTAKEINENPRYKIKIGLDTSAIGKSFEQVASVVSTQVKSIDQLTLSTKKYNISSSESAKAITSMNKVLQSSTEVVKNNNNEIIKTSQSATTLQSNFDKVTKTIVNQGKENEKTTEKIVTGEKQKDEAIKKTKTSIENSMKTIETYYNKLGGQGASTAQMDKVFASYERLDNLLKSINKATFNTSSSEAYAKSIQSINSQFEVNKNTIEKTLSSEKELSKQRDAFNSKNLNFIDLEIKKREQLMAFESKRIQSQMQQQAQQQAQQQTTLKQLDSLIFKTQEFEKKVGTTTGGVNTQFSDKTNALLQQQLSLQTQIQQQGYVTPEQITRVAELNRNLTSLSGELTRAQKAQTTFISQGKSIDNLIEKYQKLANAIKNSSTSSKNTTVATDVQKVTSQLQAIQALGTQQGYFTPEQISQVENYRKQLSTLKTTFDNNNKSANSFLNTIASKARWLAAFYLVNQIRVAFREMISTIKETEMAVVELQRVLSEDIGEVGIQQAVYGIAGEYGRTFEEVSDTAVKFAQAGYEWNEVLTLTESTMLAVNTAELEVTSATTGLIAVISQFNLEASDMEGIIDKINKTADSFPVTSEKIVSALQRAGSASNNANVSLEETIAIITSLSKATGRSGEVIGTAINSLISFSQRSTSLEIFAGLSDEMGALVNDFNVGTASIVDLWQGLSNEISSLSGDQAQALEALYSSDEFQQFADELESEASEITTSIREVYQTAGTNRQNYFIGLLNEMSGLDSTYTQALDVMSTAQGYSLKENELYMATLTAEYQQLIVAVKELAVQFGNAGFLSTLKTITQLSTGTLELVKNLGGLNTVLALTFTTFAIIKGLSVGSLFTNLVNSKLITNLRIFNLQLKENVTQLGLIKGLNASIGSLGWIGLAFTGLSFLNNAYSEYIQKQKEALSLANQNADTTLDLVKAYSQLKDEYSVISLMENEAEQSEALVEWKNRLIEQYGFEEEALRKVNIERQNGIDLLNQEISTSLDQWLSENAKAYADASEIMSGFYGSRRGLDTSAFSPEQFTTALALTKEQVDELAQAYEDLTISSEKLYGEEAIQGQQLYQANISFETKSLLEQKQVLEGLIGDLSTKQTQGIISPTELDLLSQFKSDYQALTQVMTEDVIGTYTKGNQVIAQQILLQEESIELLKTVNADNYNDVVEKISQLGGENVALNDALRIMVTDMFPQFNGELQDVAQNASEATSELDSFFETINSMSDQATFLRDLNDDFAEFKTVTTDMMDSIIDKYPELDTEVSKYNLGLITSQELIAEVTKAYERDYDNYVQSVKNKLSLDNQYYGGLIDNESDKVRQFLEAYGVDFENFKSLEGAKLELQTEVLAKMIDNYSEYYSAMNQSNGITLDFMKQELAKYQELQLLTGGQVAYADDIAEIQNIIDAYEAEMSHFEDISFEGVDFSVKTNARELEDAGGSLNSYVSKYEQLIDVEQARLDLAQARGDDNETQIKHLTELQRLTHLYAEELRAMGADEAEILALSSEWWALQDEKQAILQENTDAIIEQNEKIIEGQIEGFEKIKEEIESRYDAEIEKLNEVQEERERIRDREEYLDNLADAKKDLAEASARSGVEYREAEEDAREEISDINQDWQQQLEDWANEDAIDTLEALKEKELELIDTVIEGLDNALEKLSETPMQTAEEAEKAMQDISSTFNNDFIIPLEENSSKFFGIDLVEVAKVSSANIYDIFDENFVTRLKNDMYNIFAEMDALQKSQISGMTEQSLSSSTYLRYGGGGTPSVINNTTNTNTNRSMNNYINATNGSSMNDLSRFIKDAFDISTLL